MLCVYAALSRSESKVSLSKSGALHMRVDVKQIKKNVPTDGGSNMRDFRVTKLMDNPPPTHARTHPPIFTPYVKHMRVASALKNYPSSSGILTVIRCMKWTDCEADFLWQGSNYARTSHLPISYIDDTVHTFGFFVLWMDFRPIYCHARPQLSRHIWNRKVHRLCVLAGEVQQYKTSSFAQSVLCVSVCERARLPTCWKLCWTHISALGMLETRRKAHKTPYRCGCVWTREVSWRLLR